MSKHEYHEGPEALDRFNKGMVEALNRSLLPSDLTRDYMLSRIEEISEILKKSGVRSEERIILTAERQEYRLRLRRADIGTPLPEPRTDATDKDAQISEQILVNKELRQQLSSYQNLLEAEQQNTLRISKQLDETKSLLVRYREADFFQIRPEMGRNSHNEDACRDFDNAVDAFLSPKF